MSRLISILAVTTMVCFWTPIQADGQRGPTRAGQEMTREQMQERIQRSFEERMARVLELSGEQRQELREVLDSFRAARAELLPRRRAVRTEARRFLERSEDDDARARELLREMRELREAETRIRQEEEQRLMEILTPTQHLRMYLLREQFMERIRRLEGEMEGRRLGPGGPEARRGGPAMGRGPIDGRRYFRLPSGHGILLRSYPLLRPLRGAPGDRLHGGFRGWLHFRGDLHSGASGSG